MSDDQLSYAEAVSELEAIVASLERDELDVDVLAERVSRAAELIKLCRAKIGGARMEVERLVAGLDPGEEPPDEAPPD